MMLKDISVGPFFASSKYVSIGFYPHCIEDLYLRNLMPYKNRHIKKLNIHLIGEADRERFLSLPLKIGIFYNLISIGEIYLYFDFEDHMKKNEYDRKLDILNKIQEGFKLFSEQTATDILPFESTYQKCIDQNLEDEYLYKEAFSNSKEYKIQVKIKVDFDKLEVNGLFFDNKGNKISEKIFLSRDPVVLFYYYLGEVKWTSDKEVILYGRSKEEFWTVSL